MTKIKTSRTPGTFRSVRPLFDDFFIKHKKKSIEAANFPAHFNPADYLNKIAIWIKNGKLVVTKLHGEEIAASSEALKEEVSNRPKSN